MHAKSHSDRQVQAGAEGDRLLRDGEVAARLGISRRQVHKLRSSGRMPQPVRLGRSIRWRASDVALFVELGAPSLEVFEVARAERAGAGR